MPDEYDGIILGTGHNSLVLQAYMARSGLRVLAVDRAPTPGGGLATIENPRPLVLSSSPDQHALVPRLRVGTARCPLYRT